MAKNRKYNYSDLNMSLAAKIIAASFKANLSELGTVRSNWIPEYADDLGLRIDGVIKNYLTIDKKKKLRDASRVLKKLMAPAKAGLASFKKQVSADNNLEKEKFDEYLIHLGFSKHLAAVQKGDQEALIALLNIFEKNMTPELKAEITSKGMKPELIDTIIGFADVVTAANLTQERSKETSKETSEKKGDVLNALYAEMRSVCIIAKDYYKSNPVKKEQFMFSKVIANMGKS